MTTVLNAQVVVITGASSGIGRATALRFAQHHAKVVLAARNVVALEEVADSIRDLGTQAEVLVVPTDVGDWEQVQRLAEQTVNAFGCIDTWVNDAGVGIYATAAETSLEEMHQIIQTNFMGVVHGVKAALPYMQAQHRGTIINVASVEADISVPYNSAYAATKHAVKGYTEVLRMELEHANSGIDVTLIMPSAINTPFFNHALSKLGVIPRPVGPVYEPELVAEAIVYAAQHPQRDVTVGGGGKLLQLMKRAAPTLTDQMMTVGGAMFHAQKSDKPDNGASTLFNTIPETGRISGDFDHMVKATPTVRKAFVPAVLVGALVGVFFARR
ncbi:MAG: SDR family oxidoreductase [Chloroflexi bacterium]|nr:SDR family oxidoreductase [Chloroflexota bacterium]MCC6891552.1 SDR family oxidoreductase [Anaerolineae bacterium]